MKQYDAKCPICGTVNKNLFLEETNGWMECEHCHNDVKVLQFTRKIPVYSATQAAKIFSEKPQAASVR